MSVLCVGQLVADMVVRPVASLPTPGQTSLVDDIVLTAGGCAANTASVLAKMGLPVSAVGVVGRDRLADVVLSELEQCSVSVTDVLRDPAVPTSAVIVLVDEHGERSFLYREGGNEQLSCEMISDAALRASDYLHVGGAMKLLNLDLAALLARGRGLGCTTSLDTDWDPRGRWIAALERALPQVDYLLTNEEEGSMLTGLTDPVEIGKSLLARGPRAVVVKRGSRGATVVTGASAEDYPAFDVPVTDTTCAGDAFAAGFIFGLSQGWDLAASARFANALGALCTTQIGHAGISTLPSAIEFLHLASEVQR